MIGGVKLLLLSLSCRRALCAWDRVAGGWQGKRGVSEVGGSDEMLATDYQMSHQFYCDLCRLFGNSTGNSDCGIQAMHLARANGNGNNNIDKLPNRICNVHSSLYGGGGEIEGRYREIGGNKVQRQQKLQQEPKSSDMNCFVFAVARR